MRDIDGITLCEENDEAGRSSFSCLRAKACSWKFRCQPYDHCLNFHRTCGTELMGCVEVSA